jgi:hypothetical protein
VDLFNKKFTFPGIKGIFKSSQNLIFKLIF